MTSVRGSSYPPILAAALNPHGAVLVDRNLTVYQAVGLPAPQGLLLAVPKYRPSSTAEKALWRLGPVPLERVIGEYGPRGVERAMVESGALLKYDGVYGAPMPYIAEAEIVMVALPPLALHAAVASGDGHVARAAAELARRGVGLEDLGLTGSRALGFHNPVVSDVDFVVYGADVAASVMRVFEEAEPASPPRSDLGGVKVEPPQSMGWRRARIAGITASWVGVPPAGPAAHCPPLAGYPPRDPPDPSRPYEGVLRAEPGQLGALLYPPCIEADGLWIVSFEFNLARLLYEGGLIEIRATASQLGGAVYIGLRERPGALRVTRPA